MANVEGRTDHLGQIFESISEMCKHWDVPIGTYRGRLSNGYSKKDALTKIYRPQRNVEERTDHKGNIFKSKKEMCNHWDVPIGTFSYRINAGMSKEKALTEKIILSGSADIKNRTDHNGIVFESMKDLCNNWNIDYYSYCDRIKRGMSVKDAIMDDKNRHITNFELNGIKYETISNAINQLYPQLTNKEKQSKYALILRRIRKNKLSIEEAFFRPVRKQPGITVENIHYKTLTEAAKKYKTTMATIRKRLERGYSPEQAVGLEPIVHNGLTNEQIKIAKENGISSINVRNRIKNGWSTEKAISIPVNKFIFVIDKKVYDNYKDIEKDYNISFTVIRYRINYGCCPEEVVSIFPVLNRKTSNAFAYNLEIIKFSYEYENMLYFKCKYNDELTILSKDEIIKILRAEREKENGEQNNG